MDWIITFVARIFGGNRLTGFRDFVFCLITDVHVCNQSQHIYVCFSDAVISHGMPNT